MRLKGKQVSEDNPFSLNNSPPKDHLIPDRILSKPGQIVIQDIPKDLKPLAGKFSKIGEQILLIGNSKAR